MTAGTACDTSVLVPALVSWHPDHLTTRDALLGVTMLPGHVLLETYSVLTRLPPPHRISPPDAGKALASLRVDVRTLSADDHQALLPTLTANSIRGGAVYDALVAATALHHDCVLRTRDRRARPTYDAVGVNYSLV